MIIMVFITVNYSVQDYDTWKAQFETHNETRKASGCLSENCFLLTLMTETV